MEKREKERKKFIESDEFIYALLALALGIVLLEVIALLKEIDGTFFGFCIGGITGLGGYLLKGYQNRR